MVPGRQSVVGVTVVGGRWSVVGGWSVAGRWLVGGWSVGGGFVLRLLRDTQISALTQIGKRQCLL